MLRKVLSIVVICTFVLLLVPPSYAQQEQNPPPIRIVPPPCPPACGNPDPVYLGTNQAVMGVWNKRVGTTARPPISDLASIQTAMSITYSHAKANGNNAAANAQKPFVANIVSELSNPSAAMVAEIQSAMKKYNGMTVSTAAVAQYLESIAHNPQLPTVVGLYNSGGIEAIESKSLSMLDTLIAQQSTIPGAVNADYRSGRMRLVLEEPSGYWQLFVLVADFFTALFTVAVFMGCAECDGGIAASALMGATVGLLSYLGIDGSTWNSGPWVDGGGDCDPCDVRQTL